MSAKVQAQPLSLNQHLIYICSRLLAYGVPLFYFLVAISFYLKTYDSAQVKITFTQIGGTMLICVWFIKILLEGRSPFQKKDLIYVMPFIAFFASGIISYIHAPYRGWALEETLRRVFYAGIALITLVEFRSNERMKRLWRWLLFAAILAVGYGVVQYVDTRFFKAPIKGVDPFIWRQAFGHRVFSTFGNPNFYGNFLVIITPLILASILRKKGPLTRPFMMIGITILAMVLIDKMQLGLFGGFDPSYRIVFGAVILAALVGLIVAATHKVGDSAGVSALLILFAFLFLNLYSTETKGAWLGFVAAISATLFLVIEYFLRFDEIEIQKSKYSIFLIVFLALFGAMLFFMGMAFIKPLFEKESHQTGFNLLWIPVAVAAVISVVTYLWIARKPWNLKKIIYGFIVLFVLSMGGMVLKYAESRLLSVSFRIFTWISTWEMIQTNPIFGNGVGSFKLIYPAFRRPEIIVLEGKSNTETDHSEDEYLEVWQDEGIIGFGIFLWMVLFSIGIGLKQLRWYSNIRAPDRTKRRKILEIQNDSRSYEVLGILGAYIGALIHWAVDVSVRFVSSGVFSLFLPALLVSYARNHNDPIRDEVRLGYDRKIRLGLAGFWTFVMLVLGMELVPQSLIPNGDTSQGKIVFFAVLAGAFIWVVLEALERGITYKSDVPFETQYPAPRSSLLPIRIVLIIAVLGVGIFAGGQFRNFFLADVHHNLAIFFSKQATWSKEPEFRGKVTKLPPDIKKKYKEFGGALEHYNEVKTRNPHFPMAKYFTGNVYNDRGSQVMQRAQQARSRGDELEANRLRKKALDMWEKGEAAYLETKKLAPNYVQTHHQMGLLYVKRAEQALYWGDKAGAEKYYDEAFEHFRTYNLIDPVFPPNHHRMVQLLLRRGKFEEAKKLYEQAIYHNEVTHMAIRNDIFPHRLGDLMVSMGRLHYTQAVQTVKDPFNPLRPEIEQSLQFFKRATEVNPKGAEGWKGMGHIYERLGRKQEAQAAFQEALRINPKDPEIRPNVPG